MKVAKEKGLKEIENLGDVKLRNGGEKDPANTQIFTPRFIVDQMIDAIGKKNICNLDYNILEPTSGDGAFTVRILEIRLDSALKQFKKDKDKDSFFKNCLKSLSMIYSIEMDKQMIEEQRDNIYTTFCNFFDKNKKKFTEGVPEVLYESAKEIISSNFMWAMTNTDDPLQQDTISLFAECGDTEFHDGDRVAYKMPEAENGKKIPADFIVWEINEDLTVKGHTEPVE